MNEVLQFIENSQHPLKEEQLLLRQLILSSADGITEHIKWNAPSFVHKGDDKLTMNFPPKQDHIKLVLHRGAKKKTLPTANLIGEDFGLLKWAAKDRAMLHIFNVKEIKEQADKLQLIIKNWLAAAD